MGDFGAACWHGCKWLRVYDSSQPCDHCNEGNDYKHYNKKDA